MGRRQLGRPTHTPLRGDVGSRDGRPSSIATVGGAVYTWGDGRDGQLGDGVDDVDRPHDTRRRAGLTADGVAMGRDFALAIVPSG